VKENSEGRADTNKPNPLSQNDSRIESSRQDAFQREESLRLGLREGGESPRSHPDCGLNSLAAFFQLNVEGSRTDITTPQGDAPSGLGLVERDNISLNHGGKNDTPDGQPERGAGGSSEHGDLDDDSPLNIEEIVRRHDELTKWRRPGTQRDYRQYFKPFAEKIGLERLSKKQLRAKAMRAEIVTYVLSCSESMQRIAICAIKSYWRNVFDLEWPCDDKRDFGKFKKTGRRGTPRDEQVMPWMKALDNEPDSYVRSIVLSIVQEGWRPDHIKKLLWEDVKLDPTGRPSYVKADGEKRRFKTRAWIVARLPPDLQDALCRWLKESPNPSPDAPVWPYRDARGRYNTRRQLTEHAFRYVWNGFMDRWKFKDGERLTPAYFRHFVITKCRQAKLIGAPRATLVGHDIAEDPEFFTDDYDNPDVESLLEDQRSALPNGPLGRLRPLDVQVVGEVPGDLIVLWKELTERKVGIFESLPRLEGILNRHFVKEERPIEP